MQIKKSEKLSKESNRHEQILARLQGQKTQLAHNTSMFTQGHKDRATWDKPSLKGENARLHKIMGDEDNNVQSS